MITEEIILTTITSIIDRKHEDKIIPNDFAKTYEIMSVIRGELQVVDADEILQLGKDVKEKLREMVRSKKITFGRTLNDFYFKIAS